MSEAATLRPKDYRFILFCLLVCALSLIIGIRYFYRAFPEASIDFQFTRESSQPVAESFLAAQGLSTGGYRHAAVFAYDGTAKVFLERELGAEAANAVLGTEVRLWRWGHRWYQPSQKEEFRVEVTPRGDIASFSHVLPEDASGADLSPEAARSLAESFLVLDMGRPIDSVEYITSQTQKRPARTDHVFTWKVAGMQYKEATYRITVTVQGDRIDGYSEFLQVPEEWTDNYSRLRSLNESATQIDMLFFVLLGVGMVITLGRRLRMRDVPWKTALIFAAIASSLQFLDTLNSFPLAEYNFRTTESYGSFAGQMILSALLGGLGTGGIILLLTAAAEPLYRESYPSHLSIGRFFTWQSVRTRSFLIASLAGITLTFFFFAYEIGFYLLANRLGAWSPAEVPYTDLLNTRLPWISVLLGGFFPAVSEEWVFRAFSIPYLGSLLRRRWLAVVLASAIWGFGHANYPNQPFFIRGIEVGIVGLILSWAMFRFGILAPLIAHYSIDAFYSAFLFLRSGNPYLVTTGAITAGINLIPLVVAAGAYLVTRRFRDETGLTNASEGTATPLPEELPAETVTAPPYSRLKRGLRHASPVLLALGGALILLFSPVRFGDFIRFRMTPAEAERKSEQFLGELGFDTRNFRRATRVSSRVDPLASQYIYTAGGIPRLNQIYHDLNPSVNWHTRFYRPLDREEFIVALDPSSGRVVAFRHALPDDAPGPNLSQAQALTITSSFLKGRGYDLTQYELKETKSEQPKQRRDTEFIWESRSMTPGAVGDARVRVEAGVLGNKIGTWKQSVKLPEDWVRNREERNIYSIFVFSAQSLFLIAVFGSAIGILITATFRGQVNWKLAAKLGGAGMLIELIRALNALPELWFDYDNRVEPRIHILDMAVGHAMQVIGIGLAVTLAVGLILACYPSVQAILRKKSLNTWGKDAVVAAVAALGGYLVLDWIFAQLHYRTSPLGLVPALAHPDDLGSYLPLISYVRDVVLSALFFSTVVAVGVYIWTRAEGQPWRRSLLCLGLFGSLLPGSARRVSEVGLDLLASLLLVGLVVWLVRVYLRNNYLAYFLSAALLALARAALSLQGHGNPALAIQEWVLWGIALGVGGFLFLRSSPAVD